VNVILLNNTLTFGDVLLGNITLFLIVVFDVYLTVWPLTFVQTAGFLHLPK